MQNLDDLNTYEQSHTHRVLIYGAPKTGKTQAILQLAEAGYNIIYFDLENGIETLLKGSAKAKSNIKYIKLSDTTSYPIAIETMWKVLSSEGEISICKAHSKVSCALCNKEGAAFNNLNLTSLNGDTKSIVVIDSLTQLTASAAASISRGKPDDYKFEFNDWAKQGRLMTRILSAIQAAQFNLICISHELEVTDDVTGNIKLVPVCGTSSASRTSAKYFGEVIYAKLMNKKHIMASSTTYATNVTTGSRTGLNLEGGTDTLLTLFESK